MEDEFKSMLENPSKEPDLSHLPYKIIQPDPGNKHFFMKTMTVRLCIQSLKHIRQSIVQCSSLYSIIELLSTVFVNENYE